MIFRGITFLAGNWAHYFAPLVAAILACRVFLWHKNREACMRYMPQNRRVFERPSRPLQWMLLALCDMALVSAGVLALMHPVRTATRIEPVLEQTATVVAVDLSRSMSSEEGYFGEEGRLGAVKRAFRELLTTAGAIQEPKNLWERIAGFWQKPDAGITQFLLQGHRVGLVTFAGDAFGQMPPVDKHSMLLFAFRQLSTKHVPVQGTNFDAALRESLSFFEEQDTVRTIILLSDGEKEESAEPSRETFRMLADKHVQVFPIVVGNESALIPGTDIETEPDEEIPRYIAEQTGGTVFRFSERGKLYGKLSEIFAKVRKASERPVPTQENLQPWCAMAFISIAALRICTQFCMRGKALAQQNPA